MKLNQLMDIFDEVTYLQKANEGVLYGPINIHFDYFKVAVYLMASRYGWGILNAFI